VSSGALDAPPIYRCPTTRTPRWPRDSMDGTGAITPEQVAHAIADATELDAPPLRLPVGDLATAVLEDRKAAPEDVPFVPGS
jgi:hypothetical protein